MAQKLRDVMTKNLVALSKEETAAEAARHMDSEDIGDVLVLDGDELCGIVTDRDIVVKAIAHGRDPADTPLGDICTSDVKTLTPDQSVSDAVKVMRAADIRRVPLVEDGKPVGIVSIGDLAMEKDEDSALADISAAAPNN